MSGEFNIYKNLDELKNTNLLAQIKNLESAKTTNNNRSLDEDDFDFESLLYNHSVKSPVKRQRKKESSCTPEKKTKNEKSRRSSSSKERSISPVMPVLENLLNKVDEIPVGRRTRRSLDLAKKKANASPLPVVYDEEADFNQMMFGTSSKGRGRAKVRGGGRGRGRGKGRKSKDAEQLSQNSSSAMSENLLSSSNDVSEQETDTPTTSSSIMDRFLQQGRQGRNRVMRSRRNVIAEKAARATNVDFVDLISSPWPRVEGMISLDSDNEAEEPAMTTRSKKKSANEKPFTINSTKPETSSALALLDISYDEENPELSVKITWKGKPEAFKLRKYQKFSTIFMELAKRENTDIDNLVFNIDNRIILQDDTPDSIDYKIYQFINGRVLSNRFNSPIAAASKKRDANKIKLKIQSDKLKRPLQLDIMKTDKLRILYIKCSEELKVGIEQLKLSFDGELLDGNDTPADLDMEGGEAIDLRIQN